MGLIHISGQVKLGMSLSVSSLFWTEKTYTSLVLEREQCPEYLLFRLRCLSGHPSAVSKHRREPDFATASLEGHSRPLTAAIAAKLPPVSDD